MTSVHSSSSKTSLYNQDFYLWIEQTVQALKNRDLNSLDWENLIEEVEGMGRSEKRGEHVIRWGMKNDQVDG